MVMLLPRPSQLPNHLFLKIKVFTEKSRLESVMSKQNSSIQCISSYSDEVTKKKEILREKLNDSKQETKRTKRREEYWKTKCTRLETSADSSVEECRKSISELQDENDDLNDVVRELRKTLKEKEEEISAMSELLQEAKENDVIRLFNKKEKTFTPQLHLCVYSLLEHNVPATQIGPTIEACLKLAGKKADHLPCQSTIANMNIQRLSLAKKQLEEMLPEKRNTTLHTDETSKYGLKYGGFSLRDEEGSYFVLGLREMATKSAENTLDKFKHILEDISDANNKTLENSGNKILGNIQNTMSDRAATELKFNELLEIYRQSLLPQIRKDYDTLDIDGKEAVNRLNNFFCGLHGLVHMANAAQKCLFETEKGIFKRTHQSIRRDFLKKGSQVAFD
ncbi:uncharacterized protein LOC134242222 [Saccostrea cucullata]|uniref:uncharacterized protein LOC134242222 n=1 Tax=Saccostrea cuccullata TaxID=36930 RepID=UPI002ED1E1CD